MWFNWFNANSSYRDYNKDKGDLTQTIIIVAGLAVAIVVAIGLMVSVTTEKGENLAKCVSNNSTFNNKDGTELKKCSDSMEEQKEEFNDNVIVTPSPETPKPPVVPIPEIESESENVKSIRSDLENFTGEAEAFFLRTGAYPTGTQLNELYITVNNPDAYPEEYTWNLEYCTSLDNSEYILVAYTGQKDVMYISSNNNIAKTYTIRDNLIPATDKNDVPTGGWISPCYTGTPYSTAEEAGITGQIGVLREGDYKVLSGMGRSLKGPSGFNTIVDVKTA